jgi:hypothetical protein
MGNGDYSKAYNLLLEEISKHPDDAEIIYLLGLCSQSGNRSSLYLKDYMQKFPDGKHAGEVLGLLIDYYSSTIIPRPACLLPRDPFSRTPTRRNFHPL